MWFLNFVIFIWTLYAQTLTSDAVRCPKGHKVTSNKQCVPCPAGYFQPDENRSKSCKPCLKCDDDAGSMVLEQCTPLTDRKCKCQDTFIPWDEDASTCQCLDGYTQKNKVCVKDEKSPAKATTSNKIPHLYTSLTSPRPQEGARTNKPPHNATTSYGRPRSTTTTKDKTRDSQNSIIVVAVIFLILTMIILTVLLCKHNMLPHMKRKLEQTRDSSFRTPVEESGDGSQDLLKQYQEEL